MTEEWRDKAHCKGEDPSIFFLEKGAPSSLGKSFCAACSVRQECLEYGLATDSVGIWGGQVLNGRRKPTMEIEDARPKKISKAAPTRAKKVEPLQLFAARTPKKENQ